MSLENWASARRSPLVAAHIFQVRQVHHHLGRLPIRDPPQHLDVLCLSPPLLRPVQVQIIKVVRRVVLILLFLVVLLPSCSSSRAASGVLGGVALEKLGDLGCGRELSSRRLRLGRSAHRGLRHN